MKKTLHWLVLAVVTAGAALLYGCNTAEGLGEDTEAAGEEIQEQAR